MTIKRYQFTDELSVRAMEIYSNSDIIFYTDSEGCYYAGFNNEKPVRVGSLESVEEYLVSFDEIDVEPEENMTFKDLLEKHRLNIKQISKRFGIPYRTVQNWSSGTRGCPPYIIDMMDEILSNE